MCAVVFALRLECGLIRWGHSFMELNVGNETWRSHGGRGSFEIRPLTRRWLPVALLPASGSTLNGIISRRSEG